MKRRTLIITISLSACLIGWASTGLRGNRVSPVEEFRSGDPILSLPPSLDAYYPPKSPQPVFRFQMIALGNALTGVVSDVLSEDMENADANLASFKELYHQLSGLVPEWGDLYPSESLIQLEKAFRTVAGSKDPTPFMDALDKVESVCSSCHHSYMAAVHFKFHWRNFGDLTLKDPLNGKDIDIARLMQILNLGFSGSWIDFNQGQADASASRFQEFNAAFQSLKETCQECHGTSKRKYFVDENSQDLIDSYGTFLAGKSEDAKKVEAAMMAIGNEICFKCHLVHIPAAYSQVR